MRPLLLLKQKQSSIGTEKIISVLSVVRPQLETLLDHAAHATNVKKFFILLYLQLGLSWWQMLQEVSFYL